MGGEYDINTYRHGKASLPCRRRGGVSHFRGFRFLPCLRIVILTWSPPPFGGSNRSVESVEHRCSIHTVSRHIHRDPDRSLCTHAASLLSSARRNPLHTICATGQSSGTRPRRSASSASRNVRPGRQSHTCDCNWTGSRRFTLVWRIPRPRGRFWSVKQTSRRAVAFAHGKAYVAEPGVMSGAEAPATQPSH